MGLYAGICGMVIYENGEEKEIVREVLPIIAVLVVVHDPFEGFVDLFV